MKLIDLFCGGGGAGAGYRQAGFKVVGVDINPQPKYPFKFYKMDAFEFLEDYGEEFDFIHASPPCQAFTKSAKQWRKNGKYYPDYISRIRDKLIELKKPYVIENVPGAPLVDPVELCGLTFNLKTYRHRLFESNFQIEQPEHKEHIFKNAKMGRPPRGNEFIQVVGHFSGVPFAQEAMGINWLGQKELAQSIPPAYTKYIGESYLIGRK